MVIDIKEPGSRETYMEVVNILNQYQRLKHRPKAKLRDKFKTCRVYMTICGVLFCMLGAYVILYGTNTALNTCMLLMVVCIMLTALQYGKMVKTVQQYLADRRKTRIVLDNRGIEMLKGEKHSYRIPWDKAGYIRRFDKNYCFASSDKLQGYAIFVDVRYETQVREFLKLHHIEYLS